MLGVMTYLIIAGFCALFLVLTTMMGFDGDIDFDVDGGIDSGFSPLSIPILMAWGATFGTSGAMLEVNNMMALAFVPITAGAIATVTSGMFYVFMVKFFIKTQASSDVNIKDFIGEFGIVSVPIRKGSVGQVIMTSEARGRVQLSAQMDGENEIKINEQVEITKIVGSIAIVKARSE